VSPDAVSVTSRNKSPQMLRENNARHADISDCDHENRMR
jgi:hypothetical protein